MRILKTAVVLVIVAAIVGMWQLRAKKAPVVTFRTVPVKRGDVVATISATGTVEPEEVVDVGAQVAGQINSFGRDKNGKSVDYGSAVGAGTILAQIDDALYASDVASANAQMEQAKASQVRAEADLGQMQAKLDQACRDWERAQKLGPSQALAPSAYDGYKAGYETAKANLAVGRAAIDQAKATLAQAQATLDRAKRNLGYCTITSPVEGVIIDRRVNIGQTVVSSLNAPSLFLIAKDLKRIQVWVSVNEADIGHIHEGQPVSFTVDAFPGRTFQGKVGKIRLNATMTQNVVTYTVEVVTDNLDGKLLPYLTANAQFEAGSRRDVLVVPNGALRWRPQPEQIAPEFRKGGETGKSKRGPRSEGASEDSGESSHKRATLWVQEGEFVRPVAVKQGLTDSTVTEVEGADLKDGMWVIAGEQAPEAAGGPSGGASPFTPQFGRGRSGGGR